MVDTVVKEESGPLDFFFLCPFPFIGNSTGGVRLKMKGNTTSRSTASAMNTARVKEKAMKLQQMESVRGSVSRRIQKLLKTDSALGIKSGKVEKQIIKLVTDRYDFGVTVVDKL